MNVNAARIAWDLRRRADRTVYEDYWKSRNFGFIPPELFQGPRPVWLEIGAGSGWFFTEMAKRNPDKQFIAVERCKKRGTRLVRKTTRSGLPNLAGFRGNAIPVLIHGVPTASVERIYILYPCPWARMSQRKNRWYLHPIMPHLHRILKPGGLLIWASDQKFYIDEARYVSENNFGLEILAHGQIAPNPHNALDIFPEGRTKFERTFLGQGLPCFEAVCRRPKNP